MRVLLIVLVLIYGVQSFYIGEFPQLLSSNHRTSRRLMAENSESSWPGRVSKSTSPKTKAQRSTNNGPNIKATVSSSVVPSAEQAWRSGYAFSKELTPRRPGGWLRNEPWWMLESESRNPRLLPTYKPWWAKKYEKVEITASLAELKALAQERGIEEDGKKAELLAWLRRQEEMYSLSDDNFVSPVFLSTSEGDLSACYPDVYEKHITS